MRKKMKYALLSFSLLRFGKKLMIIYLFIKPISFCCIIFVGDSAGFSENQSKTGETVLKIKFLLCLYKPLSAGTKILYVRYVFCGKKNHISIIMPARNNIGFS